MNKITVNASRKYDVIIGSDLLHVLPSYIDALTKKCTVAIISDSNVWPLYGHTVETALAGNGYRVCSYIFPAGEASKNPETYLKILNFLAEEHVTRSDLIIALGGGVVGDMTGFAAATFLRGVPYIQIPTTLLAMVDSSVGGKTAIDLPAGKNLMGAFYQPHLVLCDIDTLNTLPSDVFQDGCAEVIKYGILYDPALFTHLKQYGFQFDREYVIARCIDLKRMVVAEDEYDTGARQKLNLGHTIGHGIEAHSKFTISHGHAVATGIAIVSRAAAAQGICSQETCSEIIRVLKQFGFDVYTSFTVHQLHESSLSDKKRSGNTVNLIIPKEIGNCLIYPVAVDQLKSIIEAGL